MSRRDAEEAFAHAQAAADRYHMEPALTIFDCAFYVAFERPDGAIESAWTKPTVFSFLRPAALRQLFFKSLPGSASY